MIARKPVSGVLPPRASVTIRLDPPMADHEMPLVFSLLGRGTVEITDERAEVVTLVNQTDRVAPFVFATAAQGLVEGLFEARTVPTFLAFLKRKLLAPTTQEKTPWPSDK